MLVRNIVQIHCTIFLCNTKDISLVADNKVIFAGAPEVMVMALRHCTKRRNPAGLLHGQDPDVWGLTGWDSKKVWRGYWVDPSDHQSVQQSARLVLQNPRALKEERIYMLPLSLLWRVMVIRYYSDQSISLSTGQFSSRFTSKRERDWQERIYI